MSEEKQQESEQGFLKWSAGIIATGAKAAMADGTLIAAGRQGIDEIGMALKAFPDAIQAQEVGTIFSPTQGEIADDRKDDLPSPSQIADSKPPQRTVHDNGRENDHGHDNENER